MHSGATFSENKLYRYKLWRTWDENKPKITWIMLNPSTADGVENDFTTKKCIKYSSNWGYGGLILVNLFAYRTKTPSLLKELSLSVAEGGEENISSILSAIHEAKTVVAAWGADGNFYNQAKNLLPLLLKHTSLFALKVGKNDTPFHPMNVSGDAGISLWKEKLLETV